MQAPIEKQYESLVLAYLEDQNSISEEDLAKLINDKQQFLDTMLEVLHFIRGNQRASFLKSVFDPEGRIGKIFRKNEFSDPITSRILRTAATFYFNSQYNSMLSGWGKQDIWLKAKKNAIEKTREFYRANRPTFSQLYWFVSNLRHEIAVANPSKNLEPGDENSPDFFGKARSLQLDQPLEPWVQKTAALVEAALPEAHTSVTRDNQYSGFLKELKELLEEQTENITGHTFKAEYWGTTLCQIDIFKSDFSILHPHRDRLPGIMFLCSNLYQSFLASDKHPSLQLEYLKKLLWVAAQAMFCARSSASISEIIFEALMLEHNLSFPYSGHQIPIDLVGICSATPQKFIEKLKPATEKDFFIDELFKYYVNLEEDIAKGQFFKERPSDYSTLDKICGAGKLIMRLKGDNTVLLSDREQHALNDPALKTILDKYKKYQFLPEEINKTPSPR